MISEQIQNLLNQLIQLEYSSAYLYQAMASYFERINLTGTAHWLRQQYQEELTHAQRLIDYLTNRNGIVEIRPIPAQSAAFGSPLEAFQQVLTHEQMVTDTYQRAYETVLQARDYQTLVILQDFLREQIDEIAQTLTIVGRLRMAGNNTAAILILDQELGRRGTAAPTPAPAGPTPPGG